MVQLFNVWLLQLKARWQFSRIRARSFHIKELLAFRQLNHPRFRPCSQALLLSLSARLAWILDIGPQPVWVTVYIREQPILNLLTGCAKSAIPKKERWVCSFTFLAGTVTVVWPGSSGGASGVNVFLLFLLLLQWQLQLLLLFLVCCFGPGHRRGCGRCFCLCGSCGCRCFQVRAQFNWDVVDLIQSTLTASLLQAVHT